MKDGHMEIFLKKEGRRTEYSHFHQRCIVWRQIVAGPWLVWRLLSHFPQPPSVSEEAHLCLVAYPPRWTCKYEAGTSTFGKHTVFYHYQPNIPIGSQEYWSRIHMICTSVAANETAVNCTAARKVLNQKKKIWDVCQKSATFEMRIKVLKRRR